MEVVKKNSAVRTRTVMSGLARIPGVRYPTIASLVAAGWPHSKAVLPVVIEPGGLLTALRVSSIYAHMVVFEVPNEQGGHRYLHLSYEQVEYPPGSITARGIAETIASELWPKKEGAKHKEYNDKQEQLWQVYVDMHWRDHYDSVVLRRREWEQRQSQKPTYHARLDSMGLGETVVQWVLEFDWDGKLHDKRIITHHTDILPTKNRLINTFRGITFANWTLTREEIKRYHWKMPMEEQDAGGTH